MDAPTKTTIETSISRLRPSRTASQPTRGVIKAWATMNDVNTQVIWSRPADRPPCMCGNATLAIVLSIVNIDAASMIEMVSGMRCTLSGVIRSVTTLSASQAIGV